MCRKSLTLPSGGMISEYGLFQRFVFYIFSINPAFTIPAARTLAAMRDQASSLRRARAIALASREIGPA